MIRLSDNDTEYALYCVNELIERRALIGVVVPEWMHRLARKLDLTCVMSSSGHESYCAGAESEVDELIGTKRAAQILALSPRQVSRMDDTLEGQTIGGRKVFKLSAVTAEAERRKRKL